ncbi:MAG: lanthionine synthetase C family protein [Bacteroidales bacterium]|nr:lanthionine synthetase C family protein [Bacteroidales bacterium]
MRSLRQDKKNWKPITERNEETNIILNNIRKCIESIEPASTDLSLSTGSVGNTLFLLWHDFMLSKKSNLDFYFNALNNKLSTAQIDSSYMKGLSGIAWFYYFMANSRVVKYDKEFEDSLRNIDKLILPSINLEAAKRNIDLFDGLNGYGEYLIEKGKYDNNYQDLYNLVKNFRKISIDDENGIRWVDNRKHYNAIQNQTLSMPEILFGEEVNLGLAHGMLGTIIILSKIYELGILKTEIKKVLTKSVKWILKQKNENEDQLFPSVTNKHDHHSNPKIGWCYGDLGIAFSLVFAGNKLQNREFISIGIDIALRCSKDIKIVTKINSPYFCHGAAGITHIYNRLYHLTGETQFLNQALYWHDKLIDMYNPNNKIGGFFNEDNNFLYGLQFGISGIGLVLISSISKDEPVWDSSILLS